MRILSDEQGTNELEAAEHIIGWLDATMDASYWFNEVDLEPEQAAMILCQFNPNEVTLEQVQDSMNDVTGPRDLVLLLREFKRFAKRSLLQWIQVAQKKPLRYHPWIDQYIDTRDLVGSPVVEPAPPDGTTPEPTAQAEPAPTPVQRWPAQEEAILAKLAELGFDAKALPPPPKRGKHSPSKQAVKTALKYSTDVMNKAWQRLLSDKQIGYASR